MIKTKFNLQLNLRLEDLEITAESEKEAEEKLKAMTYQDLIDNSFVDDSEIEDYEYEVEERDVKVHVYAVDYDFNDEDFEDMGLSTEEKINEFLAGLKQEFDFTIHMESGDDLDELVSDAITDETDYLVETPYYDEVDDE